MSDLETVASIWTKKEINKDRIQPFQRRHWGSPQHFAGCTNHCVGTLTRNKWINLKRTIMQLNQVTLSWTYSPSASFTKLIVMCSQSSPWPCIALSQLSETYVGDTWSTPKGSQPFCLPYQKCLRWRLHHFYGKFSFTKQASRKRHHLHRKRCCSRSEPRSWTAYTGCCSRF